MGRMTTVAPVPAPTDAPDATGLGTRREPCELEVLDTALIAPDTLRLGLARVDGAPVRYEPGHFCNLAIPGPQGEVWRSYSLATPLRSGEARDRIEVVAAAVPGGLATEYLFARRPGDRLRASGPFGRLLLPAEDPEHYLLMGTGTGLAPYRAMLPELERRAAGRALRVTVVMGVRSPAAALYLDEFRGFVARDPQHRRLRVRYSRVLPDAPAPDEAAGYVQESLPALGLLPATTLVYLCGNPGMIDAAAGWLDAAEFPRRRVVREKYQSRSTAR